MGQDMEAEAWQLSLSVRVRRRPSGVSERVKDMGMVRSAVLPWSCFSKAWSLLRQSRVPGVRLSGMRLGRMVLPWTWLTRKPSSRWLGLRKHRPSPGVRVSDVLIVMESREMEDTLPMRFPMDF